ncbi:hypothetical protein JMJ77_0004431, partial [Colletotrichum scovillei]
RRATNFWLSVIRSLVRRSIELPPSRPLRWLNVGGSRTAFLRVHQAHLD